MANNPDRRGFLLALGLLFTLALGFTIYQSLSWPPAIAKQPFSSAPNPVPGPRVKDEASRQQLFAIMEKAKAGRHPELIAAEAWLSAQSKEVEFQGMQAYDDGSGQFFVGRRYLLDGKPGALHFQVQLAAGKLGPFWNPEAGLAQEERSSLLFFFMAVLVETLIYLIFGYMLLSRVFPRRALQPA